MIRHKRTPTYLLERLNNVLYQSTEGHYHMTFFHASIDLHHNLMTYACAAHPPCYVYRPSQFTFTQRGEENGMLLL